MQAVEWNKSSEFMKTWKFEEFFNFCFSKFMLLLGLRYFYLTFIVKLIKYSIKSKLIKDLK